ncbi:hypothetical protein [Nannocystis punicea]|uniref:Uncharacterized protein n=1 Tax=Nannocystis punicea TaxID=2995304 RepID=A0ABY7GZT8_9BACT|nr:hypothetical protein [Nannocystis poenicansa]WAS92506.1 hypothetical protein O0S08_40520 [Nannocystis poenicansa]
MRPLLAPLALLAVTLPACPGTDKTTAGESATDTSTTGPGASTTEPTSSTTDTGEPGALCPEHTAADACCCFEAHMNISSTVENVCGTTSLCPAVEFECSEIDETCTTADEDAVNCMLDALAAGTMIGSLSVHYDIDSNYGQRKLDLYLQGDRTAYVADKEELDVSGHFAPTGRYELREAAYFDTCRAAADIQAKADCLEDLVTGEASEVCIDAFEYET